MSADIHVLSESNARVCPPLQALANNAFGEILESFADKVYSGIKQAKNDGLPQGLIVAVLQGALTRETLAMIER